MASLISQLNTVVSTVEKAVSMVDSVSPTLDQLSKLTDLTSTLIKSASRLQRSIESTRYLRTRYVHNKSQGIKQQAKKYLDSLASGNLSRGAVFRRNIVLIFRGPNASSFDRADVRAAKDITRERCAILRSLNIDGVISWAISYHPTMWAGGNMSSDVFDYLVKDIEPDGRQIYPQKLLDMLTKLKDDLLGNAEYERFLEVVQEPSIRQEPRKKHERIEHDIEPAGSLLPVDLSEYVTVPTVPRHRVLEMIGEPFLTGVMRSKKWLDEVNAGSLAATNCVGFLLPKDNRDAVFIARLGYQESFSISEHFCFGQVYDPGTTYA